MNKSKFFKTFNYPIIDKLEHINELKFDPKIPELYWTEKGEVIIPDLTGLTMRDAISALQVANFELSFKGSGRVVQQYPKAGSNLAPKDKVEVVLR